MNYDILAAILVTFLAAALLGGLPEKNPGKPALYWISARLVGYFAVLAWLLFR